MFAIFLAIVAFETQGRDLSCQKGRVLARMAIVTKGAVILGSLMSVFPAQQRFVTIEAGDGLFGRVGVRVVAVNTFRLPNGGMKEGTFCLRLMAGFTCCGFPGGSEQSGPRGTVRVVAVVALVPKNNFMVPATFVLRVALKAKAGDLVGELVFKVRAVGVMTVLATLLSSIMNGSSLQHLRVAVQAGDHRFRRG